jgi:predicted RNA binding protein with dsRBD fold (UPF0201 family)
MRHPVRHGREEAQVRHRQDLDQARAECERAREQAAVRLSNAARAAASGNLDFALQQAQAGSAEVEIAQKACERHRQLSPSD